MSKSSKDKMQVALFPIMEDTWELNTQKHNISYGKKSMKTAPKIEIDTPELDEEAFGNGVFRGIPTDEIGGNNEKAPFCYSFHHWHFYKSLTKKSQKIFKKMINDMILLKLEQMLEYPENWMLDGNWIGQLNPNYQILVLKNLHKAMNEKTWHRGSDLFMESALADLITENFDCAKDLRHDDLDGEENAYMEDWNNWLAVLGMTDEELSEEYGFPYEDIFWDSDWEIFKPTKKAIRDYYRFLLEK
jgi:hypothetical protein